MVIITNLLRDSVIMLSLRYETSHQPPNGPNYSFNLESNFESTIDLNSLIIIAYQKDLLLNDFLCITPETIQSSRFVIGRITPKRSTDGYLKASITFNCQEETNSDKRKILQNSAQTVTIALVRGNLNSHHLLHALAHFDIPINRAVCNGRMGATIDAAGKDGARYFDTNSFRQVDEAPLVFLPRKRAHCKTYYQPPKEEKGCAEGEGSSGSGKDRGPQFYGFIFDDDAEVALPPRRR